MTLESSFRGIPRKPGGFKSIEDVADSGLNPEETLIAKEEVVGRTEEEEDFKTEAHGPEPKEWATLEEVEAYKARLKNAGRQISFKEGLARAKERRKSKKNNARKKAGGFKEAA